MAKAKEETPLMAQHRSIKAKYPDAILLFRVGDFYETFGQDAIVSSQILGITLTKRNSSSSSSLELAERAILQHICLCRNEDVLFPESNIETVNESGWKSEKYPGFELIEALEGEPTFRVGFNRFNEATPMFGSVISFGDPVRKNYLFR